MSQNSKLDPRTGDYVLQKGRIVEDDSLDTPCYIRLKGRRTQWMYAPDKQWGSDFYQFSKRHLPKDDRALVAATLRALQPLIDSKRAVSVDAQLTGAARNGTEITSTVVDAAGRPSQLTFNPIRN